MKAQRLLSRAVAIAVFTTLIHGHDLETVPPIIVSSQFIVMNPAPNADWPISPPPASPASSIETSPFYWLGAFLVAALLFPAAAPILGRILAVLVNRVPALAGPAGVVSVEAFDAIVTAIERSKEQVRLGNESSGANPSQRTASVPGLSELDASLARELDASHKRLVSARKRALRRNDDR